jgi:hypothetical protein
VRRRFDMTDVDFAQFLSVLQNIGQLFLEKLRLFVAQVEAREFRHVSNIEIGALGHKLEMEMVEQPNGRRQKRNHQHDKKNSAFPPFFSKRTTALARSGFALTPVLQR